MKSAFCALLLAACVSTPHVAPERIAALKEVDQAAVAGCTPRGRHVGVSTLPGEDGLRQAREEARARAVEAGATHIVQGDEENTPDVITSAVKAYDCSP